MWTEETIEMEDLHLSQKQQQQKKVEPHQHQRCWWAEANIGKRPPTWGSVMALLRET